MRSLLPKLVALCLLGLLLPALANDARPKEVSLILNGDRLVASNVRFSRFDELKLNGRERIEEQGEAKGVILVITNQRILGYGISSGWRELDTIAGERIEAVRLEDYAAFVTTNLRYINFNGETGQWGRRDRKAE